MDIRKCQLGMIGLGQMGLGMSRNLIARGFRVMGYDLRPEANEKLTALGGTAADSAEEVMRRCDIPMTSLVSPVLLELGRTVIVPHARPGQIFIDFSTVPAPRTRELAALLAEKGVPALDAPVTGGQDGAERGTLRVFVGGEESAYRACLPVFEAISRADGVTYGGPAGMGQVLKVVQQLKNRITDAVRLETIAFGVRAGLSFDQVRRALDVSPGDGDPYERLIHAIEAGEGDTLSCLNTEWGYYLEEARERGIPMPALRSLHEFCKPGRHVTCDTQGRTGPSLWRELLERSTSESQA